MKALVYKGPSSIVWQEVPDPRIQKPTDAIVKIETTTICGTDLHILKGDVPRCNPGASWVTKGSASSPRSVRL